MLELKKSKFKSHRSGDCWDKAMDNLSVYQSMCTIIDEIQKGEKPTIATIEAISST